MKKLLIILSLSLTIYLTSDAQSLGVQAYMQQTVMGLQSGFGAFVDYGRLGLGYVQQATSKKSSEYHKSTYTLQALELRYAVANCGNIRLVAAPRIGLVNKQFVAVIPEIQTQVKINNIINITIGAGMRARRAAVSAGITVNTQKLKL